MRYIGSIEWDVVAAFVVYQYCNVLMLIWFTGMIIVLD